ncbi:hypothetical protein [Empedobacter falsenii]|uniref:hypothetical protein n=1 Tax=Empedobacter falsenii TaxID=343874 RepID=UPI003A80C60A
MISKVIPINEEMSAREIYWVHNFNIASTLDQKASIIHYLYFEGFNDLAEALTYNCTGWSVNLNKYIDNGESNLNTAIEQEKSVRKSTFKKIIKKVYSLTKTLFY